MIFIISSIRCDDWCMTSYNCASNCCFESSGINLMQMCNVFLTQNITEIVVYSNAAEERPWVRGGG